MKNTAIIYVEDFIEDNSPDDASGIRAAIQKAIDIQAKIVFFEPRSYILRTSVDIQTEAIAHDAGSSVETHKACHIPIHGAQNLTLQGATNDKGEPATIFIGYNDLQIHNYLPAILWCEDSDDLQVNNIAFTRGPEFTSAGVVIANEDDQITVEVFPGNPCYDGMGSYCMNRFHPITGALVGESVTYGDGAGDVWRLQGERLVSLTSSRVASKVQTGEHVSWHQGARTDFQTYFANCNQLTLKNLRIYNANGFAILTESCHDITADHIVFKPAGNQLFTAPRDAWKIFKCSGNIEVSRMYIEGVRMDGQNMHSNWLVLVQHTSANEALFFCKYTFAPLQTGSLVELYHEDTAMAFHITDWSHVSKGDNGNYYRISFDRELPIELKEGALGSAFCWKASRYICKDSEFVNIAGAGHLVRYDHLYILNCTYRNTMNPGILLGAELPVHSEGGHASDIVIKGCEFDNCGFFPRYGASGCIGIKSYGFSGKFNRSIIIANNRMKNAPIGIHAVDVDDVYLIGNVFEGIEVPIKQDDQSSGKVWTYGDDI
ncbi:hypothetical protein A8709_13435 [Paenibacillus pectinilyticus]|uniref:Pectate lyase superfamily protein domain-containing protein n=1 Tax=Paenibacillus pectinilyticus TaxID=512399 RepID=A0A1C1A3I3_9BACL|nr:hypothetical protein [Paenibacillus pectinilyticus]OCT15108.1 hypothetical protein A8709_13435 [Paenibacillus pectinilyticus]